MHKYHKTCSKLIWPFYGLIQLYERKIVAKFISPRVVCTNIPNRVLSWFDFFTAHYNYLNKNVTKLIYQRVLCTNITKRVLSWFDRFTAYYNCISKNVTKFIIPRVVCTNIPNRVLLIWLFYGLLQRVRKLILRELLCKYHKSCS